MHRSVHAMHAPHEQLSAIAPAAKSSATDSWLGGPVADRPHPRSRPGCPGCPRSPRAAAAAAAARPGAPTALPWSSYSGSRCAQTAGRCGPPTPPGVSLDQRARWSLVACRGQASQLRARCHADPCSGSFRMGRCRGLKKTLPLLGDFFDFLQLESWRPIATFHPPVFLCCYPW